MIKRLSVILTALLISSLFISGCAISADDGKIEISRNEDREEISQDNVVIVENTVTSEEKETPVPEPQVIIKEEAIPEAEWQLDVTFPDWRGDISSTYPINNCVGFFGYSGQGQIYLECDDEVTGFDLFINGRRIDVSSVEKGKSYAGDISDVTVNGMNSIQLSGVENGNVRVCIPYPVVINGIPDDVGIDEKAFELIDRIISADIENGFSSAQLAVVKDGRLVYENSWGNVRTYDEKGERVDSNPVTADTLYDLASNTKMYSVNYAIQYLLT